jgi:hypothetical protein
VIEQKLGTPQNVPQILQPIASVAQQIHLAGSTLGRLHAGAAAGWEEQQVSTMVVARGEQWS